MLFRILCGLSVVIISTASAVAETSCWTCKRVQGTLWSECKETFWGTFPDEKVYQSCRNSVEPPPGVHGPVLQYCVLGPRCLKVPGWDVSSDVTFITDWMLWRHVKHLNFTTAKATYSLTWNWEVYDTASPFPIR